LQAKGILEELLGEVVKEPDSLPWEKPTVVIELAPGLRLPVLEDVTAVIWETKVDGVLMGNKTVQRPSMPKPAAPLPKEAGGLSGPPPKPLTIEAFKTFGSLLPSSMPLIA